MDVYKMVTERIINQLENGIIPWKKPWVSGIDGAYNRNSKKQYSILNQLLLKKSGEYATLKQWSQLGGKVKKGEKSEFVIFWKMQEELRKDEEGNEHTILIPLLRYYNVFHISQIEGVEPLEKESVFDTEPIEEADRIFYEYLNREHIKLNMERSNRAFYSPLMDSITLPELFQFEKAEEFYSTAFHEAIHSTLKASRCDREEDNKNSYFGSENYSKEELIAEIGSASILNYLGIEIPDTFRNSTAYIQSWIGVLQNDKKFIVSASGKAEKAAKYILGIQ